MQQATPAGWWHTRREVAQSFSAWCIAVLATHGNRFVACAIPHTHIQHYDIAVAPTCSTCRSVQPTTVQVQYSRLSCCCRLFSPGGCRPPPRNSVEVQWWCQCWTGHVGILKPSMPKAAMSTTSRDEQWLVGVGHGFGVPLQSAQLMTPRRSCD